MPLLTPPMIPTSTVATMWLTGSFLNPEKPAETQAPISGAAIFTPQSGEFCGWASYHLHSGRGAGVKLGEVADLKCATRKTGDHFQVTAHRLDMADVIAALCQLIFLLQ